MEHKAELHTDMEKGKLQFGFGSSTSSIWVGKITDKASSPPAARMHSWAWLRKLRICENGTEKYEVVDARTHELPYAPYCKRTSWPFQ